MKPNWYNWGQSIYEDVVNSIGNDFGDRGNAHYYPELATKILSPVNWIPLWSNISRDKFGYNRVPATSALSESNFNDIKTG